MVVHDLLPYLGQLPLHLPDGEARGEPGAVPGQQPGELVLPTVLGVEGVRGEGGGLGVLHHAVAGLGPNQQPRPLLPSEAGLLSDGH